VRSYSPWKRTNSSPPPIEPRVSNWRAIRSPSSQSTNCIVQVQLNEIDNWRDVGWDFRNLQHLLYAISIHIDCLFLRKQFLQTEVNNTHRSLHAADWLIRAVDDCDAAIIVRVHDMNGLVCF